MAASFQDLRAVRPRPVVLVQHGAAQSYHGDAKASGHPSYTGGREREHVVLNLCPSERDAAACRRAQPDVPAVAVGCPKLDRHIRRARTMDHPPTVAVSFHADVHVCPESRWAWPHYGEQTLTTLRDDPRWTLIGHAHPRAFPYLRKFYDRLGIEAVEHLTDVLDRADCYVIDNSSSGYESAAVGIPTVWMNAPWYRAHVHHGLRFWELIPGEQVNGPAELPSAVARALADPTELRALRERVSSEVYTHRDGRSAERAAQAIRQTLWRDHAARQASA